jgi:hypothetical protein
MPRIAVVQDGTELARQTDADITGCYEACCAVLSRDGSEYEPQIFTDQAAAAMLKGLTAEDFDCVVFASNALNAGSIRDAMRGEQSRLPRYLQTGGGVVILHQASESLSGALPDDLRPGLADRSSGRGSAIAAADDKDDVLLHYPTAVPLGRLTDGGFDTGPPSLYYKALEPKSLPEKLKPVLRYGDDLLAVRTYDHVPERVVVISLPLDWQRAGELLANAIRFAARGRPRRLVWYSQDQHRRRLLMHWLALDGTSSIRPAPAQSEPLDPVDGWLLRHVDVLLVPPTSLDAVGQHAEVRDFLMSGGTVIAADDPGQGATSHPERASADDLAAGAGSACSSVAAIIGGYTERRLASRLYAELNAVSGWDAADYAFELRNIVAAVAFLWQSKANRTDAAVSPAELAYLVPEVRRRLRDNRHREDLSSSIALAQSLALLSSGRAVAAGYVEWMLQDPRHERFDVALQIAAVTSLARRQPAPTFGSEAVGALRQHQVSLAAVARVLDAIGILSEAGHLDLEAEITRELTLLICEQLEQNACTPRIGWLSVEATADVVRGLVPLLQRLPRTDATLTSRAVAILADAVVVLRQAIPHECGDRKAVAHLARVTHAVVLADRHFPIGLQRLASIEWPESALSPAATAAGESSLLDSLTVENKVLRAEALELRAGRLAARVGRVTATLGVTAVIAVPFAYLLAVVGFQTVWALIGNIAIILGLLLGITGGAFTLLDRNHLLAGPAKRVRDWIAQLVPALANLSQLKSK